MFYASSEFGVISEFGVLSEFVAPLLVMLTALALVTGAYHLLRYLGRHSGLGRGLVLRAYRPSQLMAALTAWWATLQVLGDGEFDWVVRLLLLGMIATGAWLLTAVLNVLTYSALRRLKLDQRDPLAARRIRTRVKVAHRVVLALVSTVAIGAMLVTFEQVRTVGVSLLASAGLIGIVAALAAQSMLSNFFAGVQVAFSDALRLDDIVVVEGEWGSVEEITLRQVVIKIWDERRLILPTSYFSTTPFENWTKSERQLLGTVELDVDWSVPFDELRAEHQRILQNTPLWDGRECGLQVIDATGSAVRVRALVSARDSSAQWQLRCLVREQLVSWLQRNHPGALPRLRTDLGGAVATPPPVTIPPQPGPHEREGGRIAPAL